MGPFLTELFPTHIRGTAQGFCFNAGRALGALFPTMVGYLSATMDLGQAIGLFTVGAYLVLIFAALLLPETNGIELKADGHGEADNSALLGAAIGPPGYTK
jgi:hypothetical protein